MRPYGLGILAQLSKNYADPKVNRFARIFLGIVTAVIVLSSFHQIWARNILALVVSLALIIWGNRAYQDHKHMKHHKLVNAILWSSRRSYCAFLLHFSFILLANTLYIAWGMDQRHDGALAIALMLIAVFMSWVAANYLYRWVEVPTRNFKLS
jgi:peptidoglycan/LPS O-acetylase OafA/YrhL